MIKGILLPLALPVVLAVAICLNGSGAGIYDVGSNLDAVYLAGESCVINMGLYKPREYMLEEFQECMTLHNVYQWLDIYEGYPYFEW